MRIEQGVHCSRLYLYSFLIVPRSHPEENEHLVLFSSSRGEREAETLFETNTRIIL